MVASTPGKMLGGLLLPTVLMALRDLRVPQATTVLMALLGLKALLATTVLMALPSAPSGGS